MPLPFAKMKPHPARRRAVALLLVLIAVTICVTLAYSFIASQGTSIAIARNVRDHRKARYVAESGLELTVEYIRDNAEWRTDKSHGTWVSDQAYADGNRSQGWSPKTLRNKGTSWCWWMFSRLLDPRSSKRGLISLGFDP